jgi:RNA polymerase sigma-70 factor (ECF subfamily)
MKMKDFQTKSDGFLVCRYRDGMEKAFEILYHRYQKPLFSFIMKMVRDRMATEDLFQLTWTRVLSGLDKYQEEDKFAGWIFGIANNACMDYFRKKTRSSEVEWKENGPPGTESDGPEDPETIMIQKEQQAILSEAIGQLSEDQRQIVLLRLYSGLTFQEISEMLDSPLNTVLGRMHYAVKNLKKFIRQTEGTGESHVL